MDEGRTASGDRERADGTGTTHARPAQAIDQAAVQRRSLRVLVLSQVLSGAGLAAGVTVGALLGEDMLGSTRFSGLPAALLTLGSAAAALLVGMVSDRHGRRPGLALGYGAGAVGGVGVAVAAVLDSPALLLVSLLVYGAGSATNLQARYAGGDLAAVGGRGTAISTVLVATTLGAVAAPNLVGPTGGIAESVGIPVLAGPFVLAAIAYALAAVVLTTWLRPDPLLTARALAGQQALLQPTGQAGPVPVLDAAAVRLGGLTMVVTQVVMIAVMTMTPVHMRDHGHGLGATGLVISLHIALMYLPSPITGRLADRYGPRPVIALGGLALLAAGLLAGAAPEDSVVLLSVALALLGLGWNLGLLGGTTLVAAAVPLEGRARVQGRVDVAVALGGATGGLSGGLVVASTSYATLAVGGGVLALAVLSVALRPSRSPATTASPADVEVDAG